MDPAIPNTTRTAHGTRRQDHGDQYAIDPKLFRNYAQFVFSNYSRKYGARATAEAFNQAGIRSTKNHFNGMLTPEQRGDIKRQIQRATGLTTKDARQRAAAENNLALRDAMVPNYGEPAARAAFAKVHIDFERGENFGFLNFIEKQMIGKFAAKVAKPTAASHAIMESCRPLSELGRRWHFFQLCWKELNDQPSREDKVRIAKYAVAALLDDTLYSSLEFDESCVHLNKDTLDRLETAACYLPFPTGLLVGERAADTAQIQRQTDLISTLCHAHKDVRAIITAEHFGTFFIPRPADDRTPIGETKRNQLTLFDLLEHLQWMHQPDYTIDEDALWNPAFYRHFNELCKAACPDPMPITRPIMILQATKALFSYVRLRPREDEVQRHMLTTHILGDNNVSRDVMAHIDQFLIRLRVRKELGL